MHKQQPDWQDIATDLDRECPEWRDTFSADSASDELIRSILEFLVLTAPGAADDMAPGIVSNPEEFALQVLEGRDPVCRDLVTTAWREFGSHALALIHEREQMDSPTRVIGRTDSDEPITRDFQ